MHAFLDIETGGVASAEPESARNVRDAAGVYLHLTGVLPEAANIDGDASFDRHILASILSLASIEGGNLAAQTGLTEADLGDLLSHYFAARRIEPSGDGVENHVDADEIEIVRDLLLANRSSEGDCGRWLAGMIARRAMEPNHLWEDLGLRERSELTRLIARHFAPLARRNDKNMRWKRFIYRMMCENDGFVMCSTPVCTNCADYELCYGVETGSSRVAPVAQPSAATTGTDSVSSFEQSYVEFSTIA
ncbi:MAG: nitrogen fixation protein NifQ [Alphaproteobacteria bacterium]|nr:nitrogen fixation protein NifQ [Alphaproteobacteria bacterium]MBM3624497.1 nitrogen fixation protein NifQ [Alphaproteobacteria bacterium]MBM3640194.1 nitrogen fixation protein NifQ [Alphaproteobacteria bacterium]